MKSARPLLLLLLLLSGSLACATLTKKNPAQLITGIWTIAGINCDGAGENCSKDDFSGMLLEFTKKGELKSDGQKNAVYRISGDSLFISDAGGNSTKVHILHIDERMMLTREEGKKVSERLDRVTGKK